jgi:hypothetical protein
VRKVKEFTQRITGLLSLVIGFGVIPFLLAQLGSFLGLWSWIDSVYEGDMTKFWILFVVSRLAFSGVWVFFHMMAMAYGEEWGFLSSEPNESQESLKEKIDRSIDIFFWVMVAITALVLAEAAMRIYTGIPMVYLYIPSLG